MKDKRWNRRAVSLRLFAFSPLAFLAWKFNTGVDAQERIDMVVGYSAISATQAAP